MTTIINSDTKCSQARTATGTLIHVCRKSKIIEPLRKIVWLFLIKLNMHLPYDSAIPLLGIYPRERKVFT